MLRLPNVPTHQPDRIGESRPDGADSARFQGAVSRRGLDRESASVPDVNDGSAMPGAYFIRLDKLLAAVELAPSISEAARKLREGAVSVDGERCKEPRCRIYRNPIIVQLGRNFLKIFFTEEGPGAISQS